MKLQPIINSLLETDLYKLTMQQMIFHKHTDLTGEYHFKCRNQGVRFTTDMIEEINEQIDHLCSLTFTKEELNWLRTIRFIKSDYVEFLRLWRPLRDYVHVKSIVEDPGLEIVVKGPIFSAMPFEIYLLEIVNEVYFRMKYDYQALLESARNRLNDKLYRFNLAAKYDYETKLQRYDFKFAEFGARRRLSGEWQDEVVASLKDKLVCKNCVGTSNLYLAKKYNMTPIGTFAHEYVSMFQGINSISPAYSNRYALKEWYDEYQGDLGTALTDTLGTDVFLKDFDKGMANLFTGVRHDSGDPYEWGEKIIAHYKKLGIDPKTKLLLFSDSLNFDKAQDLYDYFKDSVKISFGIGTFITNDTDVEPLNIVIKLQYVNNNPVAKISDNPNKSVCNDINYLEYLKRSIDWRLNS